MLSRHVHILILEMGWFFGISLVWLLNINILRNVFVKLVKFANIWSNHSSNVFLFILIIIVINGIIIVVEIIGGVRCMVMEVAHWLLKVKLWDLLVAILVLFKWRSFHIHSLNIFLIF